MRRSISLTAVGLALFVGAAHARADVDTDVPVPAKIEGSLGDGEVETFRFFAPEGATLSAKLATKKRAAIDVALRLLDPDGVEQPMPTANVTDNGAAIKVKKLAIARTGTWALEVSADRPGDYKLSVKTKLPKKLSFDVTLAGDPVAVTIPTAFGSTLKITAKAPRGGTAVPVLQVFDGVDISLEGKRTESSHKATVVADGSADLVLEIAPDGGDGPVSVAIAIKPPKTKAVKLNVTPAALGRLSEGETIVGRVIQPAIGGVVAAGPESDIFGASLDVPAGALTDPALISLSSTVPASIPDSDTVGAGPTIELQLPAVQFGEPATLSVPIDSDSLPIQAMAADIRILEESSDGSTRTLLPESADIDAGVATTPISGSATAKASATTRRRYTAIAPAGSPPLAGRKYWGFAFDAELEDDFSQRDESGVRRVFRGDALVEFDPDGTSWSVEMEERELRFGIERGPGDALQPVFDLTTGIVQDSGTWVYGSGGRRVRLFQQGEPGEDRLFVSRDGSILLNTTEEIEEGVPDDALLDVFVERPQTLDPSALVVGTYHFGELHFGVGDPGGGGLLELFFLSSYGTLTFKTNGTLSVDVTHVEAEGFDGPSPGVFRFDETRDRASTTWSVDPTGRFAGTIVIDDGDGGEIRVYPHRDGRMFVATRRSSSEEEWAFFVGVRTSSGRSVADLVGNHAVGTCFFQLSDYQIEDGQAGTGQFVNIPDFELSSESSRLLFDGAGSVTLSPRSSLFQERDPQSPGGVRRDRQIDNDLVFGYSLAKNGKFQFDVEGNELRGGVTPDASFGFAIQDPDDPTFGLIFFVDRPPQQGQGPQQ